MRVRHGLIGRDEGVGMMRRVTVGMMLRIDLPDERALRQVAILEVASRAGEVD